MLSPTSELIVIYALLRCYAEDLERVPLLADLKHLLAAPLDLVVCLDALRLSVLLISAGICG